MDDLTLEQQFRIRSLSDDADSMTREQAIQQVKDMLIYIERRENAWKNLMNWSMSNEFGRDRQETTDIRTPPTLDGGMA